MTTPRRAWVMVLGDVGRSPRMQYHTLSLCKTPGFEVTLIGYRGAQLIEGLQQAQQDGRLTVSYIPELPRWLSRLPGPLRLVLKAVLQLLVLLYMLLWGLPRPDVILLQLPPAIPTMIVCRLAALRHGACLVFDWHNFAYTLMAIGMGRGHPLVRLAEKYERYWAGSSQANLCVTKAMGQELERGWGMRKATVFYDRPPEFFRPASLQEKHALLSKLQPLLAEPLHLSDFASELALIAAAAGNSDREETVCTVWEHGAVRLKPGRPAIVVSSTSWTPDEDFGLLLKAAKLYNAKARRARNQGLPRLLILVTGRGPQRAQYEASMRSMDLTHVAFRTVWLEPEDYPTLLGSADLGVSLHASSSGLDLPMKVVDMFGCGLPVCALSYACISELVSHGHNGLLFSTPEQLAQHLQDLFQGFPPEGYGNGAGGEGAAGGQDDAGAAGGWQEARKRGRRKIEAAAAAAAAGEGQRIRHKSGDASHGGGSLLSRLRRGVEASGMARWHDAWRQIVLPLLKDS